MAAGELVTSLLVPAGNVEAIRVTGAPIDHKFGPGSLYNSGKVVALKAAKHPNAAQVFVNWLLSKEGREVLPRVDSCQYVRARPRWLTTGAAPTETKQITTDQFKVFPQRWNQLITSKH